MDHYDRIPFESKEQFLIDFLSVEKEEREASKIRRLLKRARFPQPKTLEDYTSESITFPANLTREKLVSMDFVQQKSNILMLGSVGTGKTHWQQLSGLRPAVVVFMFVFFEWPI